MAYQNSAYGQSLQRRDDSNRMWKNVIRGAVIMGAPMAATVAGPAIAGSFGAGGGGGAAAGGAVATGAGGAGTAGVATAAGAGHALPWLGIGSKAADTLFGIYANKQASTANRQALAYQQAKDQEAMAYERQQDAENRRQFDMQQAEMKRQWDASQKFEADKWAATQEDRMRSLRLDDEREARRAPYRAASAAALERLPGILASGRTSPGLGSFGSFRRG